MKRCPFCFNHEKYCTCRPLNPSGVVIETTAREVPTIPPPAEREHR